MTSSENHLPSNYQQAVSWIDEQLTKPNLYNLHISQGVIVNDLHKCLTTKRERLINLEGYNQKINFLQVKIIKDYLLHLTN